MILLAKMKTIAVVGIGRVGLALALVLAKKGFNVYGVDIDPQKLESLARGEIPFIENGAREVLREVYGRNFSVMHQDMFVDKSSECDAIILTLGTLIDNTLSPDLTQIKDFFEKFSVRFKKNQLVVLRSTLSPGTTEYIKRFLEDKCNFKIGKDILLSCCPERIAEGNAISELQEIPQIIGTFDEKSKNASAKIFSHITKDLLFTDPRSAELAKLFCNMYRYIDFAIGNEFMLIAESHGRDIYEILHLVNDGYKRGGVKSPGFTAGACLVKDGFFLIDQSPYLDLIAAAWRINESIPRFVTAKLLERMRSLESKKIALLGLAFKRDIDDTRYSLSLKLEQNLLIAGARVVSHDPYVPSASFEEAVKDADAVIIAVNHKRFKELSLQDLSAYVKKECVICDIWNLLGTGKVVFSLDEFLSKKTSGRKHTNGTVKVGMKKFPISNTSHRVGR